MRTLALAASFLVPSAALAQVTATAEIGAPGAGVPLGAGAYCPPATDEDLFTLGLDVTGGASRSASANCFSAAVSFSMSATPDAITATLTANATSTGLGFGGGGAIVGIELVAPAPVDVEVSVAASASLTAPPGSSYSTASGHTFVAVVNPGQGPRSASGSTILTVQPTGTNVALSAVVGLLHFGPGSGSASVTVTIRAIGSATSMGTGSGGALTSIGDLSTPGSEFIDITGPAAANGGVLLLGTGQIVFPFPPLGCDLLVAPIVGSAPLVLTNGELLVPVANLPPPGLTLQAILFDGMPSFYCTNSLVF